MKTGSLASYASIVRTYVLTKSNTRMYEYLLVLVRIAAGAGLGQGLTGLRMAQIEAPYEDE